jgi:ketosteroid isomerase-like protein
MDQASIAPIPAELDGLLSEQAIRRVLHRYARGIDRLDLELVRDCYWPDATDQHGPFTGSRDDYIEWAGSLLRRHTMTMHHLTSVDVDQHGDVAGVETYGVAYHCGEPAGDDRWNNAAGFRYLDRFERREGQWRIARRLTVVEWVTPWQRDAELSSRFGDRSRRDRTDPVYSVNG